MRKLAIFSFSFAVSTILYVMLIDKNAFSVSLYVGLVCVAAISPIVLCFFRMDSAKRVRIAAFGLCAGFLWCWVYERTRIQPLEDTADSGILHARLLEAPQATQYGCRVLGQGGHGAGLGRRAGRARAPFQCESGRNPVLCGKGHFFFGLSGRGVDPKGKQPFVEGLSCFGVCQNAGTDCKDFSRRWGAFCQSVAVG